LGIGVLTAAILYARRFFDPMEEIAIFYNSYQSAASALEKISGVLEEEPSVPESDNPTSFDLVDQVIAECLLFLNCPHGVSLGKY